MKIMSADWRHLVYLNFAVDPESAQAVLPEGAELDLLNGSAWVCWVGKIVEKVRVLGILLPDHQRYAHLSAHLCVKKNEKPAMHRLASWVPQALTGKLFGKEKITVGPTSFAMHFEEGGRDMHGRPYSNGVIEYRGPSIEIKVRTTGLPVPVNLDPDDPFFLERKQLGRWQLDFPSFFVWDAEPLALQLPPLSLALKPAPESVRVAKGSHVIWRT